MARCTRCYGGLAAHSNAKLIPHMGHMVEMTGDTMDMSGKMMMTAADLKRMAKQPEGPGVGRGFECTVPRVVCVTTSQECAMSRASLCAELHRQRGRTRCSLLGQ